MKHRTKPDNRRADAIRTALGQLGWHAKPKDLVALLANYGVEVSAGIVQRLRIDLLKNSNATRNRLLAARSGQQRKVRPFVKKVPTPRTYHR